jgi:hypothetical protein
MARLQLFIGVTGFIFVACTSMTTIQAMNPMNEWRIAGHYDTIAFCLIDKFEAGTSYYTKLYGRNKPLYQRPRLRVSPSRFRAGVRH